MTSDPLSERTIDHKLQQKKQDSSIINRMRKKKKTYLGPIEAAEARRRCRNTDVNEGKVNRSKQGMSEEETNKLSG